jgi:site-specific DNA-cytosine methylase
MDKPKLLELFCGTKSVGNVFEQKGYEVISLDYKKKFNPTICENILTWDYKIYAPDYFDVIWASPDCTTWSVATCIYRSIKEIYGFEGKHKAKAELGNQMVLRCIEILKYFKPRAWFMENPRGRMAHFPPLIEFEKEHNVRKLLVYYGNYDNWGFPKATNIWSNLPLWENEKKPTMDESLWYRDGKGINRYYAFQNSNAKERSRIPPTLIENLYASIV